MEEKITLHISRDTDYPAILAIGDSKVCPVVFGGGQIPLPEGEYDITRRVPQTANGLLTDGTMACEIALVIAEDFGGLFNKLSSRLEERMPGILAKAAGRVLGRHTAALKGKEASHEEA